MKLLKMGINVKIKILIWHMVGEMVKTWGRAKFYLSCSYSCTLFFLVKNLLGKLKNLYTSQTKTKNVKGVKMVGFIKTLMLVVFTVL